MQLINLKTPVIEWSLGTAENGIKTRANRQIKKANTVFHLAILATLLTLFIEWETGSIKRGASHEHETLSSLVFGQKGLCLTLSFIFILTFFPNFQSRVKNQSILVFFSIMSFRFVFKNRSLFNYQWSRGINVVNWTEGSINHSKISYQKNHVGK